MIFDTARYAFSATPTGETLSLSIRRQEARTVGRNGWRILEEEVNWQVNETAIIVVDMWNEHWSWGATERVNIMAPRMNIVLQRARQRGVQIIHAPSDTIDFYKDHPARVSVLEIPHADPPPEREMPDPPQPVDASDGGSDTGETDSYKAWHRQHPAIEIDDGDAISDNGQEVLQPARAQRYSKHHFYGGSYQYVRAWSFLCD